ncbi:MAG: hypothetical protein GC137_06270 [Alphaproteobacteria bacterium]|nr:hypothetical protein [Alphaproteobacteria bacterium]
MKKFLALTVALGALTLPAFADHHEGGDWFAKLDSDGNGSISKTEFLDHKGQKFDKMDADGNGEVSKEEMMAAKEKWKEKKEGHHGEEHQGEEH